MTTGSLTSFILYSLTGKIQHYHFCFYRTQYSTDTTTGNLQVSYSNHVYKGHFCSNCHGYVYADFSEQFIPLLSMQLARQSLPCQDYTQL